MNIPVVGWTILGKPMGFDGMDPAGDLRTLSMLRFLRSLDIPVQVSHGGKWHLYQQSSAGSP